jgi:hypothetical protein
MATSRQRQVLDRQELRAMKRLFVLLLVLSLAPVAALSAQDAKLNIVTTKKPKSGGANLITQAEIEFANVSNAYEAIQRLRPQMLRKRAGSGTGSAGDANEGGYIKVYVDNAPLGGIDLLTTVDAAKIKEVRFLNAIDATQRWGTGNPEGAILIITRK